MMFDLNGHLLPREMSIEAEDGQRKIVQMDWSPRAATAVQARGYYARYDESSTGRLAPPASTPLDPGALDERLFKTDASVSHLIGSTQMLQGGVEFPELPGFQV